jgi:hypothetical protein
MQKMAATSSKTLKWYHQEAPICIKSVVSDEVVLCAGLFEWSIKQQEGASGPGRARQLSEEDRKWFMEAMEAHTQDISKRMKEIKATLDERDDSDAQVAEKLKLLEDLTEIVEHIDYARGETRLPEPVLPRT